VPSPRKPVPGASAPIKCDEVERPESGLPTCFTVARPVADPHRTRWSQVTHYYFENSTYITPMLSDVLIGREALTPEL
jgi:hypothetical protein